MRVTTFGKFLRGLAAVVLLVSPASAAVILTSSTYSENFNDTISSTNSTGLFPGAGTQTGVPAGGSGSSGWVGAKIGGNTNAMNYVADNGGSNAGAIYSYGATGSTERALGSVASGTAIGGFGVEIVNGTGVTIQDVSIDFVAEFWRRSSSTQNTTTFGYNVGAAGSTTFLASAGTSLASLDLVGPAAGTNEALDGNLAANQDLRSGNLTNLNWLPGDSLYLRWRDTDDVGSDAGLAVDNFSLTAVIVPEPGSLALLSLASLAMVGLVRRHF